MSKRLLTLCFLAGEKNKFRKRMRREEAGNWAHISNKWGRIELSVSESMCVYFKINIWLWIVFVSLCGVRKGRFPGKNACFLKSEQNKEWSVVMLFGTIWHTCFSCNCQFYFKRQLKHLSTGYPYLFQAEAKLCISINTFGENSWNKWSYICRSLRNSLLGFTLRLSPRLCLPIRRAKWTPTTRECRATEATFWTSSGTPSTTTSSPPAPRTPRCVRQMNVSPTCSRFLWNMSM